MTTESTCENAGMSCVRETVMGRRAAAEGKRGADGKKCLIFVWMTFFLAGSTYQKAVGQEVVPHLAPFQAESSLVTQRELDIVENWVMDLSDNKSTTQVRWIDGWLASSTPFTFTYDGKHSDSFLSGWDFEARQIETTDAFELRRLRWSDPRTRLEIACELKQFTDLPAVECLVTFENKGPSDTPIIENIQSLRLRMNTRVRTATTAISKNTAAVAVLTI